jgi:hypothetical protein
MIDITFEVQGEEEKYYKGKSRILASLWIFWQVLKTNWR